MATLLYRIGHFAYRRAWLVIGVWLLIAVAILGGAFALGGKTQESFRIPGTESQEAIDRLAAVFPQTAGASAQIVMKAPEGQKVTSDANTALIEDQVSELGDIKGVNNAISPFSEYATNAVSDDKSTVIVTVQFDKSSEEVSAASLEAVQDSAKEAQDAGWKVGFGGQVFTDNTPSISPSEGLGVVFAAVVLIITFGSLLAAGMPLLTALLGVGVTMGGVLTVSAFTTISSSTPLLALMIGLAVGIDYALFILSRHRTQMAKGMKPVESAATAVATAGSSVVFAGITVIIALLGLLVVQIPFLSAMGVSAAGAVLVAILVSITLLPALMGLAGKRLAPKEGSRAFRRATATEADESSHKSMGTRWVDLVLKVPIIPVVLVVGVLGALAIPAASLNLALPSAATQPAGTSTRDAYDLIADEFGPGYNGPLVVLVDITQTDDIQGDLASISDELSTLPNVAYVGKGIPNASVDTAIIQVIPGTGPDSKETTELVQAIRDLEPQIEREYGTSIAVTGTTAVQIDISTRLDNALVPFGLIVVGLSILLLMMVFRSVFVPLKAALGFLLSVLASFGVVVAIFQWGFMSDVFGIVPGPILSFMPILLMAVLFGLAMDYEVFLVSGMREEFVRTGDPRAAIRHGFTHAARVVTAAALIMFFVFFAFVPEGEGVIKVIALGLAVGIAFDAFLVRMTFGPAMMALAGRGAWWLPKWLDRLLPNVDIEGEHLREHQEASAWAGTQQLSVASCADLELPGVPHPVTLSITGGSIVQLGGDLGERRVLGAAIAGRLTPLSGHLQVLGFALPSEAGRVIRASSMVDSLSLERTEGEVRLGALLDERVSLSQPWYRAFSTRAGVRRALTRLNAELERAGASVLVTTDSDVSTLPPLERAATLLAIALAERTRLVVIDLADGLSSAEETRTFLAVAANLAPESTTVVIGLPAIVAVPDVSRHFSSIDLTTLKGALR